jgi:hypothetical protein
MYYSANPPGYLESALSFIDGPEPEFGLDELFPGAN